MSAYRREGGGRRTLDGAFVNANGVNTATPNSIDGHNIDGKIDNRGFTGHEMLDALDLVHMNGRIYEPMLGRFLSADPILQDPMNRQSYNRYSYVLNNPTNLTDPTGFETQEKIKESCGTGGRTCGADGAVTGASVACGGDCGRGGGASSSPSPGIVNLVAKIMAMPAPLKDGGPKVDVKAGGAAQIPAPADGSFIDNHAPVWASIVSFRKEVGDGNLKTAGAYGILAVVEGVTLGVGTAIKTVVAGFGKAAVKEAAVVGAERVAQEAAQSIASQATSSTKYFRGAKLGEPVHFIPRVGTDVKIDKVTGFLNPEKGVSVFNNAQSVINKGFVPYEINMLSVPGSVMFKQTGKDLTHFELLMKPGTTLDAYTKTVCTIACK